MHPRLFEHWDCGRVEDDNIDDKMIAVRSNGKNITINHEGGGGGKRRDTAASKVREWAGGAVITIAAL